MARLKWDEIGERRYETGTNKGVLYVQNALGGYESGVAWSGLVSVKQSPDGAEETPIYADNIKYLSMMSAENFKGSIDAYTYPDEFAQCEGSVEILADSGVFAGQQTRKPFGLVYSTIVGNDTEGNDHGEKIHIIYNAKVSTSERAYETVNDTPAAITFSWSFSTTPVSVDDSPALTRPPAYISVDATKMLPANFAALQDLLYGDTSEEPTLPTLAELLALVTGVVPG